MAKGVKIDPAFQAAPYLGDSSQDPIAFTRNHNLTKYRAAKQRSDELKKSTQEGLENLMLNLKGWEDQEGFSEIMARQDKALKLFTDLSKKGLNLTSPKTSQEIEAYRTINNYHAETKQKVDEWNRQKDVIDLITQASKQDSLKPESERKIDQEATRLNIDKALKGKSISDRKLHIEKLLVFKPEIGDVHKYVADNMEFITKPEIVTEPYNDPVSGQIINKTREVSTPQNEKQREQDLRKLFKTAPEPVKTAVKTQKEKETDSTLNVMNDEDYFISMYDPKFKEKFIDKASGQGGGFAINLFGQKVKSQPAIKNNNNVKLGDRDYNEHYDFNISKPLIGVNLSDLGAEVYDGGKWTPASKEGGLVNAQMNFYDPKTDSFIFTTTSDGMDAGVFKAQTFSVPRANLGKEVDDLPIKKDDGKTGKLKDIYGKEPAGAKKLPLPENFWSTSKPKPYIPKTK
jgi:hypothetical protein